MRFVCSHLQPKALNARLNPSVRRSQRQLRLVSLHSQSGNGTPGGPSSSDPPDWVKDLLLDADDDEDVADLVQGTGGNPEAIRERIRQSMERQQRRIETDTAGEEQPMKVEFREVDNFGLWVWLDLYKAPAEREKEMLDEIIKSWFVVGRLGGFNSMNLQVMFRGDDDISYFKYNQDDDDTTLPSTFHEMTEIEYRANWARFQVDLGTADEMGLDVLINMLGNFSREYLGIKQAIFGGVNPDWTVPSRPTDADDVPMTAVDPMQFSRNGGGAGGAAEGGVSDLDEEELVAGAMAEDGYVVEDKGRLRGRRSWEEYQAGAAGAGGAEGGAAEEHGGAVGGAARREPERGAGQGAAQQPPRPAQPPMGDEKPRPSARRARRNRDAQ